MSVYIVTGKLGSGKTLLSCMKIQEYLKQNRRVVTNIDIRMESLCKPDNDYSRIIRCPDQPTRENMDSIGMGCDTYNEDKFGGIFLDEAGIWLNSRQWNKGGRNDFLEFLLYLRKRRWDLYLLVQNIKLVDKQIREAVAEHVVYLTRWDRIRIPGIHSLVYIFSLGRLEKLPQIHHACVKYGSTHNSLTADNWYFRGDDYYNAYNTTQEFDADYQAGIYSLLPPAYLVTSRVKKWTKEKIMRLTKIYWRKYSRPVLASVFFCVGVFVAQIGKPSMTANANVSKVEDENSIDINLIDNEKLDIVEIVDSLSEYENFRISEYASIGQKPSDYFYAFLPSDIEINDNNEREYRVTSDQLKNKGFRVYGFNECSVQIISKNRRLKIGC